MRASLLSSAACLALAYGLAPGLAAAQSAPQGAADTSKGATLETIIVTAQRVEQDLQKVPVAVDVVQGTELARKGVTDLAKLQDLSPALTVQATSSGNNIFLRGVGNFTLTNNSDPAVSFNYDGIYIGRPAGTNGVFYDLARVEILKGPQGILYGRNATGGAINVIPTSPTLNGYSGQYTASVGNYNAVLAQGGVNLPVTDNSALRLAASYSKHDGYLKDGTDDDDTKAARLQYLIKLTDNLKVRLGADIANIQGAGVSSSYAGTFILNPATKLYVFTPSNLPISGGLFTPESQAYRMSVPAAAAAGRKLDALTPYPKLNNTYEGLNAEVTYDSPIGTFTFIPAYRETKLKQNASAAAFVFLQNSKYLDESVELRLNGSRGRFDYVAGTYWYYGNTGDAGSKEVTTSAFSSTIIFGGPTSYKTRSFASFGSVTAHVTDQFRLTGGLRNTSDDKSFFAQSTTGIISCLTPATGCPNAPLFPAVQTIAELPFPFPTAPGSVVVNGALVIRANSVFSNRQSGSRTTYRLAAEYDLTPQAMAYASYETGYRSGGFNTAVGFETYQPEYLYAATLGVKSRLFDNRLLLNAEAFHWDYKNEQVSHVGVDLSGRATNFTQNVGQSVIYGLELNGVALVDDHTRLKADVQYLHTNTDSFLYYQSAAATAPLPLTGCKYGISPTNAALYQVDCSGKPNYNSPKWTINLGAEHRIPLDKYEIILSADTSYRSSRYIGFNYLPQQMLSPTWTSNAEIGFGPPADSWRVSAFVRNIEDDRIQNFTPNHPTAPLLLYGTAAPRTYGVRLAAHF